MLRNSKHSGSDTDVPKTDLSRTPYNAKLKYESLANQQIHPRRDILSNRDVDSGDSKIPSSRKRLGAAPKAPLQLDVRSTKPKDEQYSLRHNHSHTDILPSRAFSPLDNLSNRQRVISDWGKFAASLGFTVQNTASHVREQLGVLPRSAGHLPLVWNTSRVHSPAVRSASVPSPLKDVRKSAVPRSAVEAVKTTAAEDPRQGVGRGRSRRPAPLMIAPSMFTTEVKNYVTHQKSEDSNPEIERIRNLVQLYAKHRVGTLRRIEAIADKVDAGSLTREEIDQALEDWAMYERLEAQFNGRVREWMERAKERAN